MRLARYYENSSEIIFADGVWMGVMLIHFRRRMAREFLADLSRYARVRHNAYK
jgi:hypothetical protein